MVMLLYRVTKQAQKGFEASSMLGKINKRINVEDASAVIGVALFIVFFLL